VLERERHSLILRLVEERSIVSVADLVELIGASEATVRRDIGALAERGEVKRVRGGAEAVHPRHQAHLVGMPFALSRAIAAPQKRAIARAAADMIGDGESIIIGGGTTAFAMAEFLTDRDLDILTNSIPVAMLLLSRSRNRITLPGGTIFREHNLVLSPFPGDVSTRFWASHLFMGCHGINRFGVMETDPMIVQAMARLIERAERLVVMADGRKLRQRSAMVLAGLDRIHTLITDDGAREEDLQVFRAAGIEVIVARSEAPEALEQVA